MKQTIALGASVFATLCFVLGARADEPKNRDQDVVYDEAKVPPSDLPPLRVQRRGGLVEMDNGLVKARFTAGNDGVKQEYLASRGRKWILLAEGFRPDGKAKPKFEVFADFENTNYGSWQTAGEAFGAVPSKGATAPEQLLREFQGERLANSYAKSDAPIGKLISPEFTIRQPFITFLVGGGHHTGGTCINLVVDDKVVLTQTGENSDALRSVEWRVADFIGQRARFEIVDNVSGGWGHIEVDQIEFTDQSAGALLTQLELDRAANCIR